MNNLIFIGNSHLDQFCILEGKSIFDKYNCTLDKIIAIPGSSIKGLNNIHSSTGLNKQILEYNYPEKTYIFHLGQVDIEFGYYYKSVLANNKLSIDEFMNNLI